MEVHQGENTYAQDNLLLGKIEISVPPKPKGKEAVDVRFTYDINGILVVDTRVVSTGVVKTHIISQKIPEAELEERVRELEKLKVHPRDLSENQQMMERLEALYQEVYPEQKEQVQQMIRTFEEFLDGQNPRQIQGYRRYLEKAVSMIRLRKNSMHRSLTGICGTKRKHRIRTMKKRTRRSTGKGKGMIIRGPADSIPDLTTDAGKHKKRNSGSVCTTGEGISPGRTSEGI